MYKKLLFVDDHADVILLLEREFCRRTDVITFSARNLTTAYEILANNEISLVVCDIELGAESGYDLARMVRSKYPKTGLILMTGWNVRGNQQRSELLDIAFLAKPFKLQDLSDLVDMFLLDADSPKPPDRERNYNDPVNESRVMAHFQPQDLVQLFCLNGRDVDITIKPDADHDGGHIYIGKGHVIHSEFGEWTGEEAFIRLMHLRSPLLNIKSNDSKTVTQTIHSSWEQLLLTAAVTYDEQLGAAGKPAG
jgi:CheY-like chemotaxis protein